MDLISRQAAIDALAEQIMESALMDNPTTASTDIDSYRPIAELSLRDVPSAQPEHLVKESGNLVKGLVNDCISRKAAIDALAKFVPYAICDESTESYTNGLTDAYNLICQLPSAQPEKMQLSKEDATKGTTFDCISRQAAIDSVCEVCENCEYFKNEKLIQTIKDLPSVQPRWIPVTERLPEESDYIGCSECIDGAVWYYTDKGAMGLGYYYKSTKSWATTDDTAPYGNVVAWRKLPEPYKEEQE